jgi:hypothetical protein
MHHYTDDCRSSLPDSGSGKRASKCNTKRQVIAVYSPFEVVARVCVFGLTVGFLHYNEFIHESTIR